MEDDNDDAGDGKGQDDDSVTTIHLGHQSLIEVMRNTDPQNNGARPYVAIRDKGGFRYPAVGFDTRPGAEEWAAAEIEKENRGMKDTDKSRWD